jgi:hypothetical protein
MVESLRREALEKAQPKETTRTIMREKLRKDYDLKRARQEIK